MTVEQAQKTRICGCGKEVAIVLSKACVCECHRGLSYEGLRKERTTVYEFPWGKVTAVRYDHLYNLVANFKDVDGGVSLGIDFSDGCSGSGPRLSIETLPAYLALLETNTPKIMAAIEKRRAIGASIAPLQARASAQADIMFKLIR